MYIYIYIYMFMCRRGVLAEGAHYACMLSLKILNAANKQLACLSLS